MSFIGELAGLLTSVAWSATSVLFTRAAQQVGSVIVNRIRVGLALVFLVFLNWAFYGYLLPFNAGWDRWMWFALSGAIGYALGDAFLFQSFVCIGTQRGMLMMSLAPLLSAGLAWIFFGETLSGVQMLGVLLTLAGVTWVILRRNSDANVQHGSAPRRNSDARVQRGSAPRRNSDANVRRNGDAGLHPGSTLQGVLFGFGAAGGQAVGFVLSKQGLAGNFPPLAGNSIRMLAAVVVLWAMAGLQGKARETFNTMREKPRVLGWLAMAAFTGPVLGATLSLFALQHTQVGVASTLIALPPVFLLPVSWLVFKEKFDWGAVLGTLVSIGGVALLFLM